MLSMDVVCTQILVILLYILIGWTVGKCGLINAEQRRYLTSICTNLILPFTIVSASNMAVTRLELADLGLCIVLIFGLFIAITAIALVIQGRLGIPMPARVTTAALLTYPNSNFLGLPLCRALFGDIAILYNAVFLVAYNALFFTWQCSMFTGKRFQLKNLLNPATISTLLLILMLLFGLRFPTPVQTVVSNTGAMITPLSLIIIGVMMSESRIALILKERRAYIITLLRNILIPLLSMLLIRLLPGDSASRLCVLVYMACPCATLTTIYAIQNNMEADFAARSVLMSTLLFALTLPLVISIGMRFFA